MENRQNPTELKKAALTPGQTLALPYERTGQNDTK